MDKFTEELNCRSRGVTERILEDSSIEIIQAEDSIDLDAGTYSRLRDEDVLIVIVSNSYLGKISTTYSLLSIVTLLVEEFDQILSDPDVKEFVVLKDHEIDGLSERLAFFIASGIVDRAELVSEHSLLESLIEISLFHGKTLSGLLAAHWNLSPEVKPPALMKVGDELSALFEKFPRAEFSLLKSVVDRDSELRGFRDRSLKGGSGLLTPEVRKGLPNRYKALLKEYQTVSKRLQLMENQDRKSNKHDPQFQKKWNEICISEFPSLILAHKATEMPPEELAIGHLAHIYSRSETYMRKLTRPGIKKRNKNSKS